MILNETEFMYQLVSGKLKSCEGLYQHLSIEDLCNLYTQQCCFLQGAMLGFVR